VTVLFHTNGTGTANADDYTASSGSHTFTNSNYMYQGDDFKIPLAPDSTPEPDETIGAEFSFGSGTMGTAASGNFLITDNDGSGGGGGDGSGSGSGSGSGTATPLPRVWFAIDDASAAEVLNEVDDDGYRNGRLVVWRSGGNFSAPLTVNYRIDDAANGAVWGTATNGIDASSLGGTVTFQPNEAFADIKIKTYDDNKVEGNEKLRVVLEDNPTTYVIDTTRSFVGEFTIRDNDYYAWDTALTDPDFEETFFEELDPDVGDGVVFDSWMKGGGAFNILDDGVKVSMAGQMSYKTSPVTFDIASVSGLLNLGFDFDPNSGEIWVRTGGGLSGSPSFGTTSAVSEDGPLKGTIGYSYSVDNATRKVKIQLHPLIGCGGTITMTASGGVTAEGLVTAAGGSGKILGSLSATYATTTSGGAITERTQEVTLRLVVKSSALPPP
jgi:hypothetical protein